MTTAQIVGLIILSVVFGGFIILVNLSKMNTLDGIKNKRVGDGQH